MARSLPAVLLPLLLLHAAHGASGAIGRPISMAAGLAAPAVQPRFEIVVGNKAYSSWSLRAWLALRMAAGAGGFAETCVGLSGSGSDASRADIMRHSPTGKVPALKDHALGVTVWDSLSICECVAEAFPEAQLWPADAAARAVSRSAAAEMHSGFGALRMAMPMNTRRLCSPRQDWSPQVLADVSRVCEIWELCRGRYSGDGPFLFGRFSIADAMYAPVVLRFRTYAPQLPSVAQAYCATIEGMPEVREWLEAAERETSRIAAYEGEDECKAVDGDKAVGGDKYGRAP